MASDLRDEAGLGGAGGDELRRLADVLADDEQRLHLLPQAGLLQRLPRGAAIRRRLRIGDGDMLDLAGGERLLQALEVGVDGRRASPSAPTRLNCAAREDDGLAVGHAALGELLDALVVGGEQRLERRGGLDLMHEVAGGAVGDLHALAGFLLVTLGDLVERVAQARRGGDGRRISVRCTGAAGCSCAAASVTTRASRPVPAAPRALRAFKVKLMTTSMPFRAA